MAMCDSFDSALRRVTTQILPLMAETVRHKPFSTKATARLTAISAELFHNEPMCDTIAPPRALRSECRAPKQAAAADRTPMRQSSTPTRPWTPPLSAQSSTRRARRSAKQRRTASSATVAATDRPSPPFPIRLPQNRAASDVVHAS